MKWLALLAVVALASTGVSAFELLEAMALANPAAATDEYWLLPDPEMPADLTPMVYKAQRISNADVRAYLAVHHHLPPQYIQRQAWYKTSSLEGIYLCSDQASCRGQFSKVGTTPSQWSEVPVELKLNTLEAFGAEVAEMRHEESEDIKFDTYDYFTEIVFTDRNELVYKNAVVRLEEMRGRPVDQHFFGFGNFILQPASGQENIFPQRTTVSLSETNVLLFGKKQISLPEGKDMKTIIDVYDDGHLELYQFFNTLWSSFYVLNMDNRGPFQMNFFLSTMNNHIDFSRLEPDWKATNVETNVILVEGVCFSPSIIPLGYTLMSGQYGIHGSCDQGFTDYRFLHTCYPLKKNEREEIITINVLKENNEKTSLHLEKAGIVTDISALENLKGWEESGCPSMLSYEFGMEKNQEKPRAIKIYHISDQKSITVEGGPVSFGSFTIGEGTTIESYSKSPAQESMSGGSLSKATIKLDAEKEVTFSGNGVKSFDINAENQQKLHFTFAGGSVRSDDRISMTATQNDGCDVIFRYDKGTLLTMESSFIISQPKYVNNLQLHYVDQEGNVLGEESLPVTKEELNLAMGSGNIKQEWRSTLVLNPKWLEKQESKCFMKLPLTLSGRGEGLFKGDAFIAVDENAELLGFQGSDTLFELHDDGRSLVFKEHTPAVFVFPQPGLEEALSKDATNDEIRSVLADFGINTTEHYSEEMEKKQVRFKAYALTLNSKFSEKAKSISGRLRRYNQERLDKLAAYTELLGHKEFWDEDALPVVLIDDNYTLKPLRGNVLVTYEVNGERRMLEHFDQESEHKIILKDYANRAESRRQAIERKEERLIEVTDENRDEAVEQVKDGEPTNMDVFKEESQSIMAQAEERFDEESLEKLTDDIERHMAGLAAQESPSRMELVESEQYKQALIEEEEAIQQLLEQVTPLNSEGITITNPITQASTTAVKTLSLQEEINQQYFDIIKKYADAQGIPYDQALAAWKNDPDRVNPFNFAAGVYAGYSADLLRLNTLVKKRYQPIEQVSIPIQEQINELYFGILRKAAAYKGIPYETLKSLWKQKPNSMNPFNLPQEYQYQGYQADKDELNRLARIRDTQRVS